METIFAKYEIKLIFNDFNYIKNWDKCKTKWFFAKSWYLWDNSIKYRKIYQKQDEMNDPEVYLKQMYIFCIIFQEKLKKIYIISIVDI